MPAGWLQNYSYTMQIANTFENRNITCYNIRKIRIFIFSFGRNSIRIKKKVYYYIRLLS